MTDIETFSSSSQNFPKQEAVNYYAHPENEGSLTNLHDFYAKYADFSKDAPVPTALIDGVEHEFPELLCLSVDDQHRIYVLRTTDEMIPQTYAGENYTELGFMLAEFDPQDKASEYSVVLPTFGKLDNVVRGASDLTLSIDAQQWMPDDTVTKTKHLYLTSQGIYTVENEIYHSLDDAFSLPQLVSHAKGT